MGAGNLSNHIQFIADPPILGKKMMGFWCFHNISSLKAILGRGSIHSPESCPVRRWPFLLFSVSWTGLFSIIHEPNHETKLSLEQLLKLLIMFILFLNHHLLFQGQFWLLTIRRLVWCWAWNVHDTWTATYPCWTSTPLGFSNIKPQTHRFHASGGVGGSKSWGDFLIMKSCLVGSKRTLVLKGFFKVLFNKSISNFSGFQVMN